MKYVIDLEKCPALYNLLTLNDVMDFGAQIIVNSADSGEPINVSKLIFDAANELAKCAIND